MGRTLRIFLRLCALTALWPSLAAAEAVRFDLPAQPADTALLAFSKQAKVEVLFSFDDLRKARSTPVTGTYDPESAINLLLKGTGFVARRQGNGKFVVTAATPANGSLHGRLLAPDGSGAPGIRVVISGARFATTTDPAGQFHFGSVRPGIYRLVATGSGYETLTVDSVAVEPDQSLTVERVLRPAGEPSQLAAVVVEGTTTRNRAFQRSETPFAPRTATGNLDRARTENDALPYSIYDRDQIQRSGVVNLNEFLQRELLDSDASTRPPEQDASTPAYRVGSNNLSLRGYTADQTVILVNGRRLPEILTTGLSEALPPDVNFIPLSLVQQVEVLPVSAAALYSGNAVGGVINIVLRTGADATATELTTTYTNALRSFDAPQSSVSLLHSQSLLGGALWLRLNASATRATPPTEEELGYLRAHTRPPAWPGETIFRATPNIRSATLNASGDLTPLVRLGSSPVTSVAPGADGSGGLAAFADRSGISNLELFRAPAGLASSLNSVNYPYGREQKRETYFGSVTYDVLPRLQLGLDVTHAHTMVHRGYEVISADFLLPAASRANPFGQDIFLALNETAPRLGPTYSEARLQFSSVVAGALLTLPRDWHLSADAQYAHNLTKYRGLAGVDTERWQQLIETGRYNPFRDTQVFAPPAEFYDRVLLFRGGPNRFVTLGAYDVLDLAVRAANESITLPTGRGALRIGGDYRRNHLASFTEEPRHGDGSPGGTSIHWDGRTLTRYSVFGELKAPLLPTSRLPRWLHQAEGNLAVRYVAADTAREANLAPTYGLKLDFAGGFTLRGSLTTASRYPTPWMSRPALISASTPGIELVRTTDPMLKQRYDVPTTEALNPDLLPEGAVTQTAGIIFRRGRTHRVRVAIDFVDTEKTNELIYLDAQAVLNLEPLVPERVERATPGPGETVGRVKSVLTGTANLTWRHSQNWNVAFDYAWNGLGGGTLELYGRLLYFQRYRVQGFITSPYMTDELQHPQGTTTGLLRYRSRFGAGWSNRLAGFGMDGHYFHSRILPVSEWVTQGSDRIKASWQFDAYLQSEVGRWLPWIDSRRGLRVQVRVNNVFGFDFPKYVNQSSGAGVQPYGDWRGRVYSLSLTSTF
ncbi:MAG: TonB-dependent receptor plug domain-containing protein [Opitutaceae bacterium]|nr:TonB-dependent receptor plug domain-containing protein [Opitutaceae bacterium]